MNELETTFAALAHWFARHNISGEGVKVTIEMPGERSEFHAELALKSDFNWHDLHRTAAMSPNQLHGIQFKITSRVRSA